MSQESAEPSDLFAGATVVIRDPINTVNAVSVTARATIVGDTIQISIPHDALANVVGSIAIPLSRNQVMLNELIEHLGPEGAAGVLSASLAASVRETADEADTALLDAIAGEERPSREDAAVATAAVIAGSFAMRKRLLHDTLSSTEVAERLGVTPQTVRNRANKNVLLGVLERGDYRFPAWQLDPAEAEGVIHGLPDVLNALEIPPLSQLSWFITPNPYFEGDAPLDVLRHGDIRRVIQAARAVEVA